MSTDPVGTIAHRIKVLRKRRGWTAEQLGKELQKHSVRWDRFTVANLESGRRRTVSITELLALARVLDVAPVNLLVPVTDADYQVTPVETATTAAARAWIRGEIPLAETDERTFFTEVSLDDIGRYRSVKELP